MVSVRSLLRFTPLLLTAMVLIFAACTSTSSENTRSGNTISLERWTYIEVDSQRAKHGDWNGPKWLKYFGLDMMDVTGDDFKDIVSGRYFYRNPGGDMMTGWERVDLGLNVDGMLFLDVDGDDFGDIIGTSLPDVYWLEARDEQGVSWTATKIGELPPTSHVNGQGYAKADIIKGGRWEPILATGEGIFCLVIPSDPGTEEWTAINIAPEASDEGFAAADIDGDGEIDIVAGLRRGTKEGDGMDIHWWKNPGNGEGAWQSFALGSTLFDADRIAVADLNGDGKPDVVVSEERYPGPDPDASLFWFEQPEDATAGSWPRHTVVTQYSLNNLDVADMDGDGVPDIITAEHKGPRLLVQVWRNDGKGNFSVHQVDEGKESHLGARVADLNNDGAPEIISIGWDKYQFLHVWRNDGLSQ